MSKKTPHREILPRHVPNQERVDEVSSDSPDPLHALVRLLARQAAREQLSDRIGKEAGSENPSLPPEQDHDR